VTNHQINIPHANQWRVDLRPNPAPAWNGSLSLNTSMWLVHNRHLTVVSPMLDGLDATMWSGVDQDLWRQRGVAG